MWSCRRLFSLLLCWAMVSFVVGMTTRQRTKRDTICALGGMETCTLFCKSIGYKDGNCAWGTASKAYECDCSKERRGIRCNLGGPNTCHVSCVLLGFQGGDCSSEFHCQCGGGNNRWGNLIDNVRNRF
ncbi:uncharacterized protein LOC131890579 [Tigriopus californicus]|uniref:uncharacterized protein LOC131890579 n=1 Tax=Tigriopus californicus TaxID=6832 RepID=UPI0027D9DE13|nr:uncharacterized protein LOC131890579 [Tigriopus californicus]